MLLKLSVIIIAIGIILLIIRIIYGLRWNISFQNSVVKGNTILHNKIVNTSKPVNASVYVSNTNPLLTLVIDHDNSIGVLEEKIIDPNQSIISKENFSQDFIYSIKPKVKGTYTATISNNQSKMPVTVSISFGYFPVKSIIDSESIFLLTVDTISIILGFILIISGVVIRVTVMAKKS